MTTCLTVVGDSSNGKEVIVLTFEETNILSYKENEKKARKIALKHKRQAERACNRKFKH